MHNKTLKDIFEDKYSELPELLENNGITTLALLNKKVFNESEIYGLSFLGDGSTINSTSFINIIVSGVNLPVCVHDIIDTSNHDRSVKTKVNTNYYFLNKLSNLYFLILFFSLEFFIY